MPEKHIMPKTRYINRGATCETCAFQNGSNRRACRKCITQNDRPGYEPAPGVKVRITENLLNGKLYREVLV